MSYVCPAAWYRIWISMNKKPSLLTRARVALNVFRRGLPDGVTIKEAPFVWPVWREGKPEWHLIDLATYISEGFNLNSLIYSALMYKARSITNAPIRSYEGDPHPTRRDDTPLAKLLARPNKYQSQVEFMQLADVYLNFGDSFIALDRPRKGAMPTAMYPLRSDRVFIIPRDRQLIGFLYVPEGKATSDGVPYLPEDMIHVKLPNPGDPLEGMGYGMSPFAPMGMSADVDNDATRFLKTFFKKGTMINTYLKFDVPLDDPAMARARKRFQEIYGGYGNWSEVGIVDEGAEIKQFGMNFKDMGFDVIDERSESRILGPLGVPPSLIATRMSMSTSTYNNREQDRTQFWEDTMLPEMMLFEVAFQYYLSQNGVFPAFDTSKVPALRKDIPSMVTAAYQLWQMGETRNNAYAIVGLDAIGESPNGDISYLPLSIIPAGTDTTPPIDTTPDDATPDNAADDTRKSLAITANKENMMSPEQKDMHWKAIDTTARKWESKFSDGANKAFAHDQREIIAIIHEAQKSALHNKATIEWKPVEKSIDDYLSEAGADNWRKTFIPLMQGVVTDQGKRWAAELGMQFDTRNLFAESWFEKYTLQFAQPINDTTSKTIHDVLAQAQAEGWSVPETQKHLTQVFKQWMTGDLSADDFAWFSERMPDYRTEAIARTETMRASNAGTTQLFGEWGVRKKEWLSTKDDRTRDSHLAKPPSGQVVGIGESFDVGGYKAEYPGDPSLPAEESINCRCTTLPVL